MPAYDPAGQRPQLQHLWAVQLPQRIDRLRRRGEHLRAAWDINVLRLLADDAARTAKACRQLDEIPLATLLDELRVACTALLDPPRSPDRASLARLDGLIAQLASAAPRTGAHEDTALAHDVAVIGATREFGFPLLVTPPASHWARAQGNVSTVPPAAMAAVSKAPAAAVQRAPMPTTTTAERPAFAQRAPNAAPASACSREQLLRQVSECLARDDAGIHTGGLLLLVPDGSSAREHASEAARSAETLRVLCAYANAGDRVASDGAGRFLVFNRELGIEALEPYGQRLRERLARASVAAAGPQPTFDVGICAFVRGARHARAMYDALRSVVRNAQAQAQHGVFVVRDVNVASDGELVDLVRFALDHSGFEVLFQPIVSLRGEEEQFQALLRLRDHDGQLHAASEIVPAAESAGLIGAVDHWVRDHCIARLAGLGERSTMHLFLSQSLASVRDPLGPATLGATLSRHGVDAGSIVLELRAADAIEAPAEVQRYAAAMRGIGVRLALSGFDEDLADVHPLPSLPVDFVKLASRPAADGTDAAREAFVGFIERLHERGTRVIAPRVEDARGAAALCSTGVDFIQGNFVQAADRDLAFDFKGPSM